jgi:hypothetical protein
MLMVVCISATAQDLEISGQIRPRVEYRHGYRTLLGEGYDPAFSVSQRTRLNLKYSATKIKTMISIQDVRTWGDVVISNKSDNNGSMIHQAWGEFSILKNLSVKAGRQVIIYDDQRLFGGSDWNQQARSHDALLLKYDPLKSLTVTLGLAYNQSADKDTGTFYSLEKNYKALRYLYLHGGKDNEGFAYSFIIINPGYPFAELQDDSSFKQITVYSTTIGPYLTYQKDNLRGNAAFYYQFGKNSKNIDKSAFYASTDFSYTVAKDWSAGAGFQYLSGNDQVNPDSKDHDFSTLFSNGHKFNGWMDYFYAGSSHKGVGLLDIYVPVIYKYKSLTAELQVHNYHAAGSVASAIDPARETESSLGTEAGIMFTYAFSPELTITGGYSQMFATASLEILKGGDRDIQQNWAWIMLSFNPVFFKSVNK